MRIGRALHLADFIKIAERLPGNHDEDLRVRIRNPDEEVRLTNWLTREFEIQPHNSGRSQANS